MKGVFADELSTAIRFQLSSRSVCTAHLNFIAHSLKEGEFECAARTKTPTNSWRYATAL
jgi:hypothetical protein